MIADFHFIRPYWLLAFLPMILMMVFLFRNRLRQNIWLKVCDQDLLPFLIEKKQPSSHRWPVITCLITVTFSIIALAGPSWERLPAPVFRNTSALIIALDLSSSMDAEDIKPSRLVRARYKISDILQRRKEGQTALIVFTDDVFVVTPLTDDGETIKSQLSALATEIMPNQGNNVALMLRKSVNLFKQAGISKGNILVVTDGVDVDNAIKVSSTIAKQYSVSILAVGTDSGAPIVLPNGGFLKDAQGTIIIPKLDAEKLSKLAQSGGGLYQTLTENDKDIENLLGYFEGVVQQQQSQENANQLYTLWDDKGPWLLLLILPLASLGFRKGLLSIFFLVIMIPDNSYAFEWQDLWQRKDQQAYQAYQQHEFNQAAEMFSSPEWKAIANYQAGKYEEALKNFSTKPSNTSDDFYNQGNALAKVGQLEQAIKAYKQALSINPENSDAQYNKELVTNELEKQKKTSQENSSQKDPKDAQQDDNKQSKPEENNQSSNTDNEQKPEQKSERSNKEDLTNQSQNQENNSEKTAKAEQNKKTDHEKENNLAKKDSESQTLSMIPKQLDEQQQANEQWLKRIPDDPSGLLRRKFKYQYSQRKNQKTDDNEW